MWDRFVESNEFIFIYGWIERPKDDYKDFILLQINKATQKFHVITSSEERHKEIFDIVDMGTPPNCQRVEFKWDIKNATDLCKRCGLCCKGCKYLKHLPDGTTECSVYDTRLGRKTGIGNEICQKRINVKKHYKGCPYNKFIDLPKGLNTSSK